MIDKAKVLEILSILEPFDTKTRCEVLSLTAGDGVKDYDEAEMSAGDKIERIIRDMPLNDDTSETLNAVDENVDAKLSLCDVCDKKTFVRRTCDVSEIECSYCILGCDDVHN